MQSCYVDSPEGDTLLDADAVVDIDIGQRFSNFFDHGPLFSSGIVGGPPHFRVATFALSQFGTGVRPFPPSLPLPPFPLAIPFFPFSHSIPFLPR